LVPVAVGRTAVAVGGIADSGLVLRLTRSRGWIGVLGTLLVGIVALNVLALSFNASSSKTAAIADELRRENSALGTDIADVLSNERLQRAATRLGLVVPEPGSILYLNPGRADAEAAADRLRRGEIALGSVLAPPPVAETVVPVETETAAVATDPVVTDPVATDAEATADSETPEPEAAATSPPAATAGGITP
jgi:hypothetical protein